MAKLVSKTYGEALFELAVEEGKEDASLTEIVALREVLKENPDFNKLMNDCIEELKIESGVKDASKS